MHCMRKFLVPVVVVLALTGASFASLASPALASSGSSASQVATVGPGDTITEPASVGLGVSLPVYLVRDQNWVPPGFSSTARQAVKASESNREMLAIHAKEHPLQYGTSIWLGRRWYVDFYYHNQLVAEVDLSPSAHVTEVWTGPLAAARYARGDFATPFGAWWVLVPFSVLFLVPFLDLRRWFRMRHLDALAVLSFLVSYLLFDHAKLVPGVWTAYPPLVYLMGRMLWLGGLRVRRRSRRSQPPAGGLAPFLTVRVLAGGLALLVVARIVLGLTDGEVADVGYASVVGAHQIVHGQPLYLQTAAHGDTYGPIAYLAYVPFELLFPWHGTWDRLPSAHAASLFFDLVTVLGLVLLGRRLRSGREGLRLGLALGWAWCACPFTLLALMMHTNDGLIAMLSVLSLLAFSSPMTRGAVLGLAAAAKFAPAALLGLYASGAHGVRRRRGIKGAIECAGAFVVVVAIAIGLFLPSGGLSAFYKQTIGFQLTRTDVFSPWALYASLEPLKIAIEVGAVLLCGLLAFFPRRRSLAQVAALAGAITIAVQLPAIHWFYYYIVWFVPFVVVALLAGEDQVATGEHEPGEEITEPRSEPASVRELVPV
jgi:hypothetical protein